jgi:hypothetical protein
MIGFTHVKFAIIHVEGIHLIQDAGSILLLDLQVIHDLSALRRVKHPLELTGVETLVKF